MPRAFGKDFHYAPAILADDTKIGLVIACRKITAAAGALDKRKVLGVFNGDFRFWGHRRIYAEIVHDKFRNHHVGFRAVKEINFLRCGDVSGWKSRFRAFQRAKRTG